MCRRHSHREDLGRISKWEVEEMGRLKIAIAASNCGTFAQRFHLDKGLKIQEKLHLEAIVFSGREEPHNEGTQCLRT